MAIERRTYTMSEATKKDGGLKKHYVLQDDGRYIKRSIAGKTIAKKPLLPSSIMMREGKKLTAECNSKVKNIIKRSKADIQAEKKKCADERKFRYSLVVAQQKKQKK